jgi:hypothetical protein
MQRDRGANAAACLGSRLQHSALCNQGRGWIDLVGSALTSGCVEIIDADFLVGASTDGGNPKILAR